MADVARTANVSVTTVSYVIGGRRGSNDGVRISEDTRQRVLDAVEAIGYRVNLPARHLRRQRTDHILLLIDRLTSPFSHHAAADIESVLTRHGFTMSIVVCPNTERLRSALEMIPGRLADGAIVLGSIKSVSREILQPAAAQGVPIVAVGAISPDGYDVLEPQDEELAIGQAVDHLAGLGHKRIAFIGHLPDQSQPELRFEAFRKQLHGHGLSIPTQFIRSGARDRHSAHAEVRHLLTLTDRPTAVFSTSDIGGISSIWAAHRMGMRVPDDLAVIGCGNIDECQLVVPSLSSAGPESPDYTVVADLLIKRIQDPARPGERHTFERWTFFPRESSRGPGLPDSSFPRR